MPLANFGCNQILLVGDEIYASSGNALYVVSTQGGEPQAKWSGYAHRFRLDANDIFLFTSTGGVYDLLRVPLGGGAPEILDAQSVFGCDMLVDDGVLFWSFAGGQLFSAPTPSGLHTQLTDQGAPSTQNRLVSDATHIYWMDGNLDEIASMPKEGGPKTVLYAGSVSYHGLTLDGGYLYFAAWQDVKRIPTAGGPVEYVMPAPDVRDLAIVGDWIYGAANFYWGVVTGEVVRAPKAGGNPEVLAESSFLHSVAADETAVYYCGDNGVYKRAL